MSAIVRSSSDGWSGVDRSTRNFGVLSSPILPARAREHCSTSDSMPAEITSGLLFMNSCQVNASAPSPMASGTSECQR